MLEDEEPAELLESEEEEDGMNAEQPDTHTVSSRTPSFAVVLRATGFVPGRVGFRVLPPPGRVRRTFFRSVGFAGLLVVAFTPAEAGATTVTVGSARQIASART